VEPGFVVATEPTPDEGPIEVIVLGPQRRPVARTRLPLIPACGPPVFGAEPEAAADTVIGVVEYPEDATGLIVTLDGNIVWERDAPPHPLDAHVAWPRELHRGAIQLTWEATSPECCAVLAYTADGGDTWLPLSIPSSSRSILADLTSVAGGQRCMLELFVTDGFTSARLRSEPYAVELAGWRIWILSPADGAQIDAADITVLAAQAFQVEERNPSTDIAWSSSLDGALGSGARLPVSLSPGLHRLTATANGSSANVTVSSRSTSEPTT
jgi:hypothetical protein